MGGAATPSALALAVIGTGAAALRLLRCRTSSRLWTLGLAEGVGFSAVMLLALTSLFAVGRLHWGPVIILLIFGATFAVTQVARQGFESLQLRHEDRFLLLVALAALLIVTVGFLAPFSGYDAKAIYGLKAKALLHDQGLEGALFQDPEVIHLHGDYPLGLPTLMALAGWVAEGTPDDPQGRRSAGSVREWVERYHAIEAYVPLAALWPIGLLLLASARVRELTTNGVARVGLLVLSVPAPVLFPWLFAGDSALAGADIPLALDLGCGIVAVCAWLRGDEKGWLVVVALLAASGMSLKLDAAIGFGTLAIALAMQPHRQGLPAAGAVVAGLALGVGLWVGLRLRTAGAPYHEGQAVGGIKGLFAHADG